MSKSKDKKLKLKNFQSQLDIPKNEETVLDYWDETDAFKRSVEERPSDNPYVFYDGPPFATGKPHYGHILVSTVKDAIPRYWTMKGYRVERVWGWDCHGLPIENIVEKELDLKGGKKGIEEYGIANFNQACRSAIWKFDQEWEQVVRRIGRWVDFKNSYKTMDTGFMESVWWAFKQLYEKDLIYEGRKVILYCPRCATPLSNFEVAMDNSYKEHQSPSTTYKYKVKGVDNLYLLAWSTTPWNKIATPALAVNPHLDYVRVKEGENEYILAKTTLESIIKSNRYNVMESYTGKELEQFEFELHYDFYPERNGKKAGVVVADEYVTAEEGTGIVTLAVYGEDDYRVMLERDIQLIEHIDEQGFIKPEVTPWAGLFMLKTNKLVNQDLAKRGLIYHDEPLHHRVPVCYRCETRLYQAPLPAWFVNIQKLKPRLKQTNEAIKWYPEHLKYGRFGKGLETAPDWNISRSRYWGTPMPIWLADKDQESGRKSKTPGLRVIGSIAELKQWAVEPDKVQDLTDIHREFVDDIEVWIDEEKTVKGRRIPEVFDCWVESGSMPYAALHYPFENKGKFEQRYPAQFIVEYVAQTRAWFYTLHVMSTGLFDEPAFEHALTTGNILAEDGAKMSKSKKNFPDPLLLIDKYGVDALRFYLMGSVVMKADDVNFSEREVKEAYLKLVNILWNTFTFYKLYCDEAEIKLPQPRHVLDKWIISRTQSLIREVTDSLDEYDTVTACRVIQEFVSDFSTWYLRRSRDRLRQSQPARQTFGWVLDTVIKVMAPITPFITETIYQNLHTQVDSIHLQSWPVFKSSLQASQLEEDMALVRKIVEQLHALRQQQGLKVRQPLAAWSVDEAHARKLRNKIQLLQVIADETNIKNYQPLTQDWYSPQTKSNTIVKRGGVITTKYGSMTVYLDTEITPELKAEGQAREIIRQIQRTRKQAKIGLDAPVITTLPEWPEEYAQMIQDKTLSKKLIKGDTVSVEITE